MIALPARLLIRYRWVVIASWVALAALLVPRAAHVQRVLAVRGGPERPTESTRASDLIDSAFPSPFAEYVAIVVHGPVRDRDDRFVAVLDSLTAAAEREPYIRQVVSTRSVAESTFVSPDHHTTFLLAGGGRPRPPASSRISFPSCAPACRPRCAASLPPRGSTCG